MSNKSARQFALCPGRSMFKEKKIYESEWESSSAQWGYVVILELCRDLSRAGGGRAPVGGRPEGFPASELTRLAVPGCERSETGSGTAPTSCPHPESVRFSPTPPLQSKAPGPRVAGSENRSREWAKGAPAAPLTNQRRSRTCVGGPAHCNRGHAHCVLPPAAFACKKAYELSKKFFQLVRWHRRTTSCCGISISTSFKA